MPRSTRRIYRQLQTKTESDIQDLIWRIEEFGADPLLTETQVLLAQAKDKFADYVDKQLKGIDNV